MPLILKQGVILDPAPGIELIIPTIEQAFARYGLPLVVTSGRDGQHKTNSLHYTGNAIDFRSKGIPVSVKQAIKSWLDTVLKYPYELYLEFPGEINEHFHLEYDPKPQYAGASYFYSGQVAHEPESYDPEAGLIPITAPLPGGIITPILAGETTPNEMFFYAMLAGIALLFLAAAK